MFLMCRPDYFGIHYVINPWMKGNLGRAKAERVKAQWEGLYNTIKQHSNVLLADPVENLPDIIFTANAGFAQGEKCLLSHFLHPQRRKEEPYYKKWFQYHAYDIIELPQGIFFEGGGDALLQPHEKTLWLGHGFRSDKAAKEYLEKHFDNKVITLELIDERFYHLDTCFCPLLNGHVMYYPPAFSKEAQKTIEATIPAEKRITVSEEDAQYFACNAILIENEKPLLILNNLTNTLKEKLCSLNYDVIIQPVNEFMKAGGATRCLALDLNT